MSHAHTNAYKHTHTPTHRTSGADLGILPGGGGVGSRFRVRRNFHTLTSKKKKNTSGGGGFKHDIKSAHGYKKGQKFLTLSGA